MTGPTPFALSEVEGQAGTTGNAPTPFALSEVEGQAGTTGNAPNSVRPERSRRAGRARRCFDFAQHERTGVRYAGTARQVGMTGTTPPCRVATNRASGGPISNTPRNRITCNAITNGTSTGLDAAMIATESIPPGLDAR